MVEVSAVIVWIIDHFIFNRASTIPESLWNGGSTTLKLRPVLNLNIFIILREVGLLFIFCNDRFGSEVTSNLFNINFLILLILSKALLCPEL